MKTRIIAAAPAATSLAAPQAPAWEQHECSCDAQAYVGGGTHFTHDYGRGGFGGPGYPVRGYAVIGPKYHGALPGIVAGTRAGLAAIGANR